MTGAVMDAAPGDALEGRKLFEPAGLTLEDIVLGVWEDLAARGSAECPICHSVLKSEGCIKCGSQLS